MVNVIKSNFLPMKLNLICFQFHSMINIKQFIISKVAFQIYFQLLIKEVN